MPPEEVSVAPVNVKTRPVRAIVKHAIEPQVAEPSLAEQLASKEPTFAAKLAGNENSFLIIQAADLLRQTDQVSRMQFWEEMLGARMALMGNGNNKQVELFDKRVLRIFNKLEQSDALEKMNELAMVAFMRKHEMRVGNGSVEKILKNEEDFVVGLYNDRFSFRRWDPPPFRNLLEDDSFSNIQNNRHFRDDVVKKIVENVNEMTEGDKQRNRYYRSRMMFALADTATFVYSFRSSSLVTQNFRFHNEDKFALDLLQASSSPDTAAIIARTFLEYKKYLPHSYLVKMSSVLKKGKFTSGDEYVKTLLNVLPADFVNIAPQGITEYQFQFKTADDLSSWLGDVLETGEKMFGHKDDFFDREKWTPDNFEAVKFANCMFVALRSMRYLLRTMDQGGRIAHASTLKLLRETVRQSSFVRELRRNHYPNNDVLIANLDHEFANFEDMALSTGGD